MQTKRKARVVGMVLVAAGAWALLVYAFIVKPVREAVHPRPACTCQLPVRVPELEGEEGHVRLGPPGPGEWRAHFHEEPQTFEQYVSGPVNWRCFHRTTFYIQPLGGAGERYREMIDRMRRHAEAFFGLPVRVLDPIPIFEKTFARERHQYDSTAIILELSKRRPADAIVLVGITDQDLYSRGLNFVFGEGSRQLRCGAYSLKRFETEDLPLFTRRSVNLLSHEAGHILSIDHCLTYACVMQGSNSLEEDDRHPMHLCPIDLQKVLWNTGSDRLERYRKLLPLYREWGFSDESLWVMNRLGSP